MLKKLRNFLTLSLLMAGSQHHHLHATPAFSELLNLSMSFDKTHWQVDHDLFVLHIIPKCGTHFMQRTIHLMTGQACVNGIINLPKLTQICKDNQILRSFQPYNPDIVRLLKNQHHKVISVIRDPRDALISHVFYMRKFAERENGDKEVRDFFRVGPNFDNLSLDDQITLLIKGDKDCMSYIDFYKERIGWALEPSHLVVKYEELLGEEGGGNADLQRATVLEVAKFIHLDLTEDQLEFVLKNMYVDFGQKDVDDGRVFERSTTGNWKTFLTPHHKRLIKEKLGKELIRLKYAKNSKW